MVLVGNPRETIHLQRSNVNRMIILKWILKYHFGVSGSDNLAHGRTSCYIHGTETSNFHLLRIS